EDDGKVARDIAASLEGMGYVIAGQADQTETAIEQVQELQPDLVLMEVHLRGKISGVDAAQKILSELDIPVIFISAHADTLTLQTAMLAQAYGMIFKPFDARD